MREAAASRDERVTDDPTETPAAPPAWDARSEKPLRFARESGGPGSLMDVDSDNPAVLRISTFCSQDTFKVKITS